jgi:predicted amidohydrolase
MTEQARQARIAVCQYEPHVGDPEGNRAQAVRWARAAAERGAQLAVLPELASSGYTFQSVEEAQAAAEDPLSGPTVAALAAVAQDSGMHIVCGLDERAGQCRHNSAVLLGPSGVLATYRKLHLFHDEQSWFTPGSSLPVVDLPFGRVGMIICYDLWFPEAVRTLALAGAELVAVPTNWVASFKRTVYDDRGYCQGDYVAMATAAQNGVVMACADRIGEERGLRFLGASIIVGADGWPVAGPASADGEEMLVADVDLGSAARARQRTPRNDLLGDRRPDAYNAVPVTPYGPGAEPSAAATPASGAAASSSGAARVAHRPRH